jgi:hypothetical protein
MSALSRSIEEGLDKMIDSLDAADIQYDGRQAMIFIKTLIAKDAFPIKKTEPKSAEEKQATIDCRRDMLQWLRTNQAPNYTGSRDTCLSLGEIMVKMRIEQNKQTQGTLRSILNDRFQCDWAVVTEIDGQKLYAHTPALLPFYRREREAA